MENSLPRVLVLTPDKESARFIKVLLSKIVTDAFHLDFQAGQPTRFDDPQWSGAQVCLIDSGKDLQWGVDLLRAAAECGFDSPVILLSDRADSEAEATATRAGAADFLPKGEMSARALGRCIVHYLERRRAELTVRESQERFRFLAENTGDVIYRLRYEDMNYEYIGPAITRLTGYTSEEIREIGFSSLILRIDSGDRENIPREMIRLSRVQGQTGEYHADYLICTKSGEAKWLSDHSVPLLDKSECMIGSIGVLSDITRRKQAEALVKEKNELLENFFNNHHFRLAWMDTEFTFIRVNEAYAAAEGKTPDYFVGRNHFELYPGERNRHIFERVLQSGKPFHGFETEFDPARDSGSPTWWDWSLQPVRDKEGDVSGLVLTLVDQTERVRARKEVEFERNRLFSLLDELPAYVQLLSPDYRVRFANSRSEELFGKFDGKHCHEVLAKVGKPCATCPTFRVFETQVPEVWEWTRSDGRSFQVYDYPFQDADGTHLVMEMGIDITERKNGEEALRQSENRLKTLSSKLLNLLEEERSGLAKQLHDKVGQSLVAVKLAMETAFGITDTASPRRQEAFSTAQSTVQLAIEMVRSTYMQLRPTVLDDLGLAAAVGWLGREFMAANPGIELKKSIEVDEREVAAQLRPIVFRITQGALENVARHSGARSVRLKLDASRSGLNLEICDDGRGFSPAKATIKSGKSGGFGLMSMQERCNLSGGSLEVRSSKDRGTTVRASWSPNCLKEHRKNHGKKDPAHEPEPVCRELG